MNKEVEFWKEDILKVNKHTILTMKEKAAESPLKKFRYCLHDSESSDLQEMIFVNTKGEYLPPHMHEEYAETQVILEGELKIVIFKEDGKIEEVFEASKNDCCFYRIEKGKWHMAVPVTNTIVIYEVRQGSFSEKTNIFPDWAPKKTDFESIKLFYDRIYKEIESEQYKKH